jgi:ATP-dependent DNA helicase RecQ
VYTATVKGCVEVFEQLQAAGESVTLYHGRLSNAERRANQDAFMDGGKRVMVATNAFGMGIDKPDIRFVVHWQLPGSAQAYYQEAGRAGRDGRKSRCVILYHFTDRRTREWFIDNEALTPETIQKAFYQMCDGAEGDVVTLAKFAWARMLGQDGRSSPTTLRLVLGELERANLVLRLLSRSFPKDALRRIREDLAAQRQERFRRLDEMTDYCKTTDCRRRTVLDYFGDRQEPPDIGFCCDNCDNPQVSKPKAEPVRGPAARPPDFIAPGDVHALLQGIDSLRWPLGRSRLSKLMRGSAAKGTENLQSHPLFGALKGVSVSEVDTFIGELIDQGLMRQGDEDEYFVCAVTQAGREAWQERIDLNVAFPGQCRKRPSASGSSSSVGDDGEMDEDLFRALRAWRTGEASAQQLPPYCVFSDKTLRALASRRPESLTELRAVPGVGDAKLEKYGDAVLELTAHASAS